MADMMTLETKLARHQSGELVESEMAYAVYGADRKLMWLPRSITKVRRTAGKDRVKIALPVWLYEKNKIQWSTKQGGLKS